MPTERIPLQRPRRGHVTSGQWLELWLGPNPNSGSVFTSREELKDAWERAREKMMASLSPGRRPAAYYEIEHPGVRRSYDSERSDLWRKGLLTTEEKATLEREWKVEFLKAQAPDFSVGTDDGLLHGDAAVQEHLHWADVPVELVKRWTAASRRRRPRAVRNPTVAAQEKATDAAIDGQEQA
jgi:hypothetical protein